ncbi:MAG: cytochrome C556 [Idiomarina sp.]|uniref:c-type cytochrome n=1 Tax=Idiomarina sp. TaxID=1874361 RepID=UPI000C65ABF0|nr:cytochrome c [Idiomarina sp.]MBT42506.1 cytochrome C556 [Idiomarina sp.]
MKKLIVSLASTAILSLGISGSALADKHAFNDAESAVDYRQSAFSIMRANFVAMAEMVKGDVDYDASIFEQRAEDFARLSQIPWAGFTTEGAMPGDNTDALQEIWDNWDDFKKRSEDLIADAKSLAEASTSGSLETIKPAFMAAAKNCKGCHDNYKD